MEKLTVPESLPILGWVFTTVLLLIAAICWAAGSGRIPPNGLVGLRIPSLMRSTAAWKAAHAAGVVPASVAFAVGLTSCILGFFAPLAYWGAVAALVGGLIWVVAVAARAANTSVV